MDQWLAEKIKLYKPLNPTLIGVVLFEYQGKEVLEIQSYLSSSGNLHQYYCDGTQVDFASSADHYELYKDYVVNPKEVSILYGTRWG